MAAVVTDAMVADYQRDGVVLVKGLFADWVDMLRAGVEENMASPSPQLMATLKPGEQGRFFDDYCNWSRIGAFEQAIRGSGAAEAAAAGGRARYFVADDVPFARAVEERNVCSAGAAVRRACGRSVASPPALSRRGRSEREERGGAVAAGRVAREGEAGAYRR